MNCCTYACHQGRDCPVRGNPPAPTAPLSEWPDEADNSELMHMVTVCIAILACAFGLGFIAGFASHLFF